MDSVPSILFAMRIKGVQIWASEGKLLYDAPRGALSPADLDTLRTHKDEIIALLSGSHPTASSTPPPTPRNSSAPVPLTFMQRHILNRVASEGGTGIRLPAVLTRLSGPLDAEALQHAFTELIRRHEILRARIVVREGAPFLDVAEFHEFRLERIPVADGSIAAREASARLIVRQLVSERIDLANDSLFKAWLLALGERDHVLLIAMDHVIFDAPSVDILQRDLCVLYARAAHRAPPGLPPIPLQFPDYALWEQCVRRTRIDVHDAYWRDRLRGARHVRVFTEEGRYGPHPKAAHWRFRFDRALTAALRAFSLRQRTTLMMSVLAAYVAMLSRWCDVSDLVVPLPTVARRHPGLQHALGPIATVLYLRIEVRPDDSFLTLLERLVGEYHRAYEHDDCGKTFVQSPRPPFASNPGLNFSSYDFRSSLTPRLDWSYASGPDGDRIQSTHFSANAQLAEELARSLEEPQLVMFDLGEELSGTFIYRADRVRATSTRQLERSFRLFAEEMARDAHCRLPSRDSLAEALR